MSSHALIQRVVYQARYQWRRRIHKPDKPGVSVLLVTWNRAKFLDLSLRSLADTVPNEHEILLWDNASKDDSRKVIEIWGKSRLNLKPFFSRKNIGTNGFAALAMHAQCEILFEMDDDILVLPKGWYVGISHAFQVFPDLGYLALDVVQDEYTNGAKPVAVHYQSETRDKLTIEFGPTGGWATAIPRKFYFATEGLPFRPHKPYFPEDGYYNRVVKEAGKRAGILKGVKAYHASGRAWNAAFGYGKLLADKHASPGAVTQGNLIMPEVGNRLPDIELLDKYRQELCPTNRN
jgi:glycosyltransferase involved in cell wall biosynthesis